MQSSLNIYLLEPVIKLTIEVISATESQNLPRSLKKMKSYDLQKWESEIVKQHLLDVIEKDEKFLSHLASRIISHPAVKYCKEEWETKSSVKILKTMAKRDDLQFLASYLWTVRPNNYLLGLGMCLGYLINEKNEEAQSEKPAAQNIGEKDIALNVEKVLGQYQVLSSKLASDISLLKSLHGTVTAQKRTEPKTTGKDFKMPKGFALDTLEGVRVALKSTGPVFYIDGYNLTMMKWPTLSIEDQRVAISKTLSQLTWRNALCHVFFDASDESSSESDIKNNLIKHFIADETADDAIIKACFSKTPAYKVVVTNDKEIAESIRSTGANVISTNLFSRAILG
jgi:hypothetical protein